MSKRVPYCIECEYAKPLGVTYQTYYCKHDKIGSARLGVDNPPKRSPLWCPKRPNPEPTPESKSVSKLTEEEKMFFFEKFGLTFKD